MIIRGHHSMTADTALRLAAWLDTTPEFWMNLQSNYDLKMAQLQDGEKIRQTVHRYDAAA